MSGVMSNILYMPSPHGQSKRIRLHHNEPFSNPFQEIGRYEYPDQTQEPDNIEFEKTTHIWMRNCQFKEERNAFLVSGCDGLGENHFSANGSEGFRQNKEDNIIHKHLLREIYKHASEKISNSEERGPVVQSLRFSETDLQNTINVTGEPSLNPDKSNLLNVSEDTGSLWTSSVKPSFPQVNDKESYPSKTIDKSRFEKRFKGESSAIVEEIANVNTTIDCSKGSSIKDKPSSRPKKSTSETKTLQCKQCDHSTSKALSEFHSDTGKQKNDAKCKPNSSCEILDNNNFLYHVEKIRQMKDLTIEPIREFVEHEVDQKRNENFKDDNTNKPKLFSFENIKSYINHKLITISNSKSGFDKGKYEAKDVKYHLNSEVKVLSWKIYSKVVRRLPDYKLFSDVIKRAMQKVKRSRVYFEPISRPKIYFEPISPEESKPIKTNVSKVSEIVKVTREFNGNKRTSSNQLHEDTETSFNQLHEDTRTSFNQLHENTFAAVDQVTLLIDLDELDDFLDFASTKIQEMILLVCSTSNDIKLLEKESEDISLSLHQIRNIEYLDEKDGKLTIEDSNIVTSTRNEILTLGDYLLQKIGSLELELMDILSAFKMNLGMVSRFVYMLCSIPIESWLTDQPDLVFAAMNQVDNQIKDVEVKEKELDMRRDCKFSEMLELKREISRFHRLDIILDELCQKYFD